MATSPVPGVRPLLRALHAVPVTNRLNVSHRVHPRKAIARMRHTGFAPV